MPFAFTELGAAIGNLSGYMASHGDGDFAVRGAMPEADRYLNFVQTEAPGAHDQACFPGVRTYALAIQYLNDSQPGQPGDVASECKTDFVHGCHAAGGMGGIHRADAGEDGGSIDALWNFEGANSYV